MFQLVETNEDPREEICVGKARITTLIRHRSLAANMLASFRSIRLNGRPSAGGSNNHIQHTTPATPAAFAGFGVAGDLRSPGDLA